MTRTVAQLMDELADHAHHLRWTVLTEPLPPALAADILPTARNLATAARYYPLLHTQDWQPNGGYPGADVPWHVLCIRCGWDGRMMGSAMRRGRRHPGCPLRTGDLAPIVGTLKAADRRHPQRGFRNAAYHAFQAMKTAHTPDDPDHLISLDLAAEYLRDARTIHLS
ncbi:hypothetical protein [Streptomyces sp. NPDC059708]|uniref:hypothetical protein n=1 Tax=Streptomyces sp. NPDC059708 TaxID=3346916 RepID=UPI0036B007B7